MARLERELLPLGAEVVKTSSTNAGTLRGLLALGLIVLLEGVPAGDTLRELAEFVTVETTGFTTTLAIVDQLTRADVIAGKNEATT